MSTQHLSDEAVAAFADGVLGTHARERAARHTSECAECAQAVRVQREAAWALRAAGAPPLPSGLLDRLRDLPQTTPVTTLPTAIGPDGSTMLATFAPMAALVAPQRPPAAERTSHRRRPILMTAAVVALAGAVTAGSVASTGSASTQRGHGHPGRSVVPAGTPANVGGEAGVVTVSVFQRAGR